MTRASFPRRSAPRGAELRAGYRAPSSARSRRFCATPATVSCSDEVVKRFSRSNSRQLRFKSSHFSSFRLASRACQMKPAGVAASTASVRWLECWGSLPRRSATGRSATRPIVPERSPGGHRLYSRDQMEQLRFIAAEVSRGLSAADAHRLLAEQSEVANPWRTTAEPVPRGCSCCSPNAILWPRIWRSSSSAPRATRCTWRWRWATPRSSGSRAGRSSRSWN